MSDHTPDDEYEYVPELDSMPELEDLPDPASDADPPPLPGFDVASARPLSAEEAEAENERQRYVWQIGAPVADPALITLTDEDAAAHAAAHAAAVRNAAPQVDLSIIPVSRYSYITGSAGTGKTTLVRAWCEENPGARLCATTGIAAVNLGDAVTINSLLGFFDTNSLRDSFTHGWIQNRLRKLRSGGVTRYILDEVSMLEGPALQLLVDAFEEVNNDASALMGHEPEIGLTLVGDFLQLPPIGSKPEDGGRRSAPAAFAFESAAWDQHFAPNVLRLTKIHRQADQDFLAGLAALRNGGDLDALEVFRPCLSPRLDHTFEGTTVFAKNQEVDRYNMQRLRQSDGKTCLFVNRRDGKELGEWRNIPETLVLKPGALVMVLYNFYSEDGTTGERQIDAANGDLAEFLGTAEKLPTVARVRVMRTGEEVIVPQVLRENTRITGRDSAGRPIKEVLGWVRYTPLRLAYCTTVHKSQGLTLDRVQLSISDPFWSAPAMLYVGVSRARTLEGLRIVGTLDQLRARVVFDPRVEEWR